MTDLAPGPWTEAMKGKSTATAHSAIPLSPRGPRTNRWKIEMYTLNRMLDGDAFYMKVTN